MKNLQQGAQSSFGPRITPSLDESRAAIMQVIIKDAIKLIEPGTVKMPKKRDFVQLFKLLDLAEEFCQEH